MWLSRPFPGSCRSGRSRLWCSGFRDFRLLFEVLVEELVDKIALLALVHDGADDLGGNGNRKVGNFIADLVDHGRTHAGNLTVRAGDHGGGLPACLGEDRFALDFGLAACIGDDFAGFAIG